MRELYFSTNTLLCANMKTVGMVRYMNDDKPLGFRALDPVGGYMQQFYG